MNPGIYVIGEQRQGRIADETLELITFARVLENGALPTVILLGSDTGPAHELAKKTGCTVLSVHGKNLDPYNALSHSKAILDILKDNPPRWVCLAHTSTGYDLGPGIAVGLEAPCITAVEEVRNGIFSRSVLSGRFLEDSAPSSPTVVLTVQPGAFSCYEAIPDSSGMVTVMEAEQGSNAIRAIGLKEPVQRDSSLKDAEVIVSAGRGLGKKKNLILLKDLAELFQRSAIGASRSACDLGWLEYSHQIGTTGQTVAPKAYFACGISGAVQHVSGMKRSQTIVAINTDQHASIFRIAHYGIIEDLTTFIPVLIKEIRRDSD